MTPKDHISIFCVYYLSPSKNSIYGDKYRGVPIYPCPTVPLSNDPKSVILYVFSTQIIFSGLISLCINPWLCTACSPLVVSRHISRNSLSSICVFIWISLWREQVPNSNRMYIVLLRTLSQMGITRWRRFG